MLYCVFNQKFLRTLKVVLRQCLPVALRSEPIEHCYTLAVPGTANNLPAIYRKFGVDSSCRLRKGSNTTLFGSSLHAATAANAVHCNNVEAAINGPEAHKHLLFGYHGNGDGAGDGDGRNGEVRGGGDMSPTTSMMSRHHLLRKQCNVHEDK